MTFEIELTGRARPVTIEAAGTGPSPELGRGRYRVSVDGHARVVHVARVGEFGLSFIADGDSGASREVQVAPGTRRGELLVSLAGRTVGVTVNGRRRRGRALDGGGHADGEQSIVAPMPGRIVRVMVGPGDDVTARQGVVVVEAMKMENELRSPKAGKVKEVTVTPGASVEAGRVLVVIE
jgi:biotin carboxyl carrier protein